MEFSLIVAIDEQGGISKSNQIPWLIKEDFNFFQDVTKREYIKGKKNVLIMGKNTFLSLPENRRPLPDRVTLVISSQLYTSDISKLNKNDDLYFADSISNGILFLTNNKSDFGKIFCCGGKQLYEYFLTKVDLYDAYFTTIKKDYNCDNIINPIAIDNIKNKYVKEFEYSFKLEDTKDNGDKLDVTFQKYCKNLVGITNYQENTYQNLLYNVLQGDFRNSRNSKVWSIFGSRLEFDLAKGFPLLTTKKVFFKGVVEELLLFLRGDTNCNNKKKKGVHIWDANTTREFLDNNGLTELGVGDMGPLYPFQWNHYGLEYHGMDYDYSQEKGFNQLQYCLDLIMNDPYSRRIIMTSFHAIQAQQSCLYPCHSLVLQFYVEKNRLSLSCYNRSQDSICGIPFNIASSALLLSIFCKIINNSSDYKGVKLEPGRLIMNLGDTHIYENHKSEAIRQILREPYEFPKLNIKKDINSLQDIALLNYTDFEIQDYTSYPNINVKMIA